jgi:hypothetical protein
MREWLAGSSLDGCSIVDITTIIIPARNAIDPILSKGQST